MIYIHSSKMDVNFPNFRLKFDVCLGELRHVLRCGGVRRCDSCNSAAYVRLNPACDHVLEEGLDCISCELDRLFWDWAK